jgi:hypothetical protein
MNIGNVHCPTPNRSSKRLQGAEQWCLGSNLPRSEEFKREGFVYPASMNNLPRPMLHWPRIFIFVLLLASAGCATAPSKVSDRLFFGRSIPGGGEVTEAQWNAFMAEVVVPRFPEGFSVWRGSGHWKGDDGAPVSERTCVLEIVHAQDPTADAKLEEIARAYRQRFNQDAVMDVRTPVGLTIWRR